MNRLDSLPLIVALRRRYGQRLSRTGYFVFGLALGLTATLLVVALDYLLTGVFGLSRESLLESGAVRWTDFGLGLVLCVLRQHLIVRRLHDSNRSGWWNVVFLLPVPWPPFGYALMAISVALLFVPGTRGPNRYGSRPGGSAPRVEGVPTLDGKPPF